SPSTRPAATSCRSPSSIPGGSAADCTGPSRPRDPESKEESMPAPRRRRDWFIEQEPPAEDLPALYTFVHAGGRADRFLDWQPDLRTARLVGMCAPGTGHRYTEPRIEGVAELAAEAARALTRTATAPYFLFGHSLGAVVAYETARRLPVRPQALIVSGCAGPPILPSERVVQLSSLPPDLFAREVRFFGGIPPELESGSEIEALLVERLRSDFAMVAEYEYRPGPLLDVPVVALAGVDDPHLGRDRVRRWQEVTSRPR